MPNTEPKILLVDDDIRLSNLLKRYLEENQFSVCIVGDSQQMNRKLEQQSFDLIILDIMLPGEDGLKICARLRATNNVIPIIMLTGKGDEIDRIVGLEIGADDYLPKPCNPRELMARIRSVLRRQTTQPASDTNHSNVISFASFCLNASSRELTTENGVIQLTGCEANFLHALVSRPNQPLSRERLMTLAQGKEHNVFDRTIDVQISKLRKLIEIDPKHPKLIQTVWGVGYRYIPPSDSR